MPNASPIGVAVKGPFLTADGSIVNNCELAKGFAKKAFREWTIYRGRPMVPRGKRQLKALFVTMAMAVLAVAVAWWKH